MTMPWGLPSLRACRRHGRAIRYTPPPEYSGVRGAAPIANPEPATNMNCPNIVSFAHYPVGRVCDVVAMCRV